MQMKAETDSETDKDGHNDVINTGFLYYALSSLLVLLCILFKAGWSVSCNIKASQSIHDRLMYSVILAPCSWFDATPVGRIVNRFSKDISTVVRSQFWSLTVDLISIRIRV